MSVAKTHHGAVFERNLTPKQRMARETTRLRMVMEYTFNQMMIDPTDAKTKKYQEAEWQYWNAKEYIERIS